MFSMSELLYLVDAFELDGVAEHLEAGAELMEADFAEKG